MRGCKQRGSGGLSDVADLTHFPGDLDHTTQFGTLDRSSVTDLVSVATGGKVVLPQLLGVPDLRLQGEVT